MRTILSSCIVILGISMCLSQDNVKSLTVKDIDGNVYRTAKIGNQIWMVENLRTTRYSDGSAIPLVTEDTVWEHLKTPGYCYYNNSKNTDSIKKLGALYNWYVVGAGKLPPKGWHIPANKDWAELQNYLITYGYGWNKEKNKIAKSLAAKSGWKENFSEGTVGKDLESNNTCDFSALPSGMRKGIRFNTKENGFFGMGERCLWWSASETPGDNMNPSAGFYLELGYWSPFLTSGQVIKRDGYSIRLVKD